MTRLWKKLMEIYDSYRRVLRLKDRSEWSFESVPRKQVARAAQDVLQPLFRQMGDQGWTWQKIESGQKPWTGYVCHYQVTSQPLSRDLRLALYEEWTRWIMYTGEIRRKTWYLYITTHRDDPGEHPLVIEIHLQEPGIRCGVGECKAHA